LYYNQGKNVREITQEARMSFRDIGAILKKKEVNNGGNVICNGSDQSGLKCWFYVMKMSL
jgi:hypothetical protein